jgi:hypothetical protein
VCSFCVMFLFCFSNCFFFFGISVLGCYWFLWFCSPLWSHLLFVHIRLVWVWLLSFLCLPLLLWDCFLLISSLCSLLFSIPYCFYYCVCRC